MDLAYSANVSVQDRGVPRCLISAVGGDDAYLIRFVLAPTGEVIADLGGKLPGAGVWLKAERSVLEEAVAGGALAESLGGRLSGEDFLPQVEAMLLKRCQEYLALGRRGGVVLGGGGKIRASKTGAAVLGLVIASDASAREARALRGAVEHGWALSPMTSDALGVPFGRPMAFVAVLDGSSGKQIEAALRRLEGVRHRDQKAQKGLKACFRGLAIVKHGKTKA